MPDIHSSNDAFETLFTDYEKVVCDGGEGTFGHPRIYLHIDSESGDITCPYCSRRYVLTSSRMQAGAL